MKLPFKNIPENLRVPLFYAEVDNSQANTAQGNLRTLIIGQITSGGIAVPGVPILSAGVQDAIKQGGAGSMLALMVSAYRAADNFGEVWLLPLADNGAGVAASGSIAFTNPPSVNGVLSLYVAADAQGNGIVPVIITNTMNVTQIAAAVAAAINANTNLPVIASSNSGTVTLNAKNKGLCGNDIDIRVNYYGAGNGEATPTGLAFTITPMASGATNPVLSAALTNIPAQAYDFIVNPFTDTANTTAVSAYLNDQTGTWSWEEQFYGHSFTSYKNSFAGIVSYTTLLNDQHTSVLGYFDSPTWSPVVAADFAATCAVSLRADPARPLQTLQLSSMLAPPLASRFPLTERNTLLFDGCSTFNVNSGGAVQLERAITTYQDNAFGQPDNSYNSLETMFTLAAILRRLAAIVTSRYARVKLADDGTKFAAGSAIVTPGIIKGDFIAEFKQMEYDGLVQDSAGFAQNIIVQRNSTNPNRIDVLWPGTLIDQLNILALLAQFKLQ